MAKCGYCGTTILLGGVQGADQKFCNDECHQRGMLVAISNQLDPAQVQSAVAEVHQGQCPKCGGRGPVDVSVAYKVWSLILMTQWSSVTQVGCRSCGRKSQAGYLLYSLVLGWWGFPWGIIMTPIQVARNVAALFRGYDPLRPSPELENVVRLSIGSKVAAQAQAQAQAPGG